MGCGVESLWKSLPKFPRYLVSFRGDVYDLKLTKMLSQQTTKDGYLNITLRDIDGNRKTFKVHRLVATLYIPNPLNKETVNHVNGDKRDNHLRNLEWNTRSENTQHAWDNKLIKNLDKRKVGIRIKQGKPVICTTTGEIFRCSGEAADHYNLQKTNIFAVCCGKKGFKSAGKSSSGEPLKWEFYNGTVVELQKVG